jgi:hypothetical protein
MSNLTKDLKVSLQEFKPELDKYITKVNTEPAKESIEINKLANNSKYLPIGNIEQQLDYVFASLWSTENFRWQVVTNEIIGSIDLKVFHPVSQSWITRTGCASSMIQLRKDADITDVSAKIKNTLVKDFPHLKAECIKNAAKSLGALFGRNLNRDQENNLSKLADHSDVIEKILSCTTEKELGELYKSLPLIVKNDSDVLREFTNKKSSI